MRKLMNFNELSQNWQNQDTQSTPTTSNDIIRKAQLQTQKLKQKKWWTIGILGLTTAILISFFVSVGAYKNMMESLGLSLMIIMLLLRVILELMSKNRLQKIDRTLDFQSYVSRLKTYFKNRRWIHFIFTPVIYLAYFGGFVAMLPVFKRELSSGFYLYILISGVVVFIGLALFIGYHIRKELNELKVLKRILEE
jgi:nitrate/nitrite transporter NarK